jgi:hypothetical protein
MVDFVDYGEIGRLSNVLVQERDTIMTENAVEIALPAAS